MALERLRIIVDAAAGGAVRDLEAVGATATKVGAQTSAMNAKTGSATSGFSAMGGTATKVAGGIGILGVAAFKAASEYADLGDEVRKFRDISGVSAETASRWVAVMDDFGIASQSGGRALRQLATETHSGGERLREFGVNVAYAKDGTVDLQGTVLNVADAYKKMNDPAARAELLAAAFGKRVGSELIPILEKGSEGVRKLFAGVAEGQILDDKDLERAREFKLAMDDLNDAAQELVVAFGAVAAGPLSTIASGLAMLTRGIVDVNDATGGLALGPLGFGMQALEADTGSLANALEQRLLKELANTEVGTRRYKDIIGQLKDAHEDAIPPTGKLAEGTRRFGQALEAETAGVKAATAAIYEKLNAELAAEGSVLAVESAQRAYNVALYTFGPTSLEARQAHLNLEGAAIKATQATQGNKKSQQELAFILSGLPPKVQTLITKLLGIPRNVKTTYTLDATAAFEVIGRIKSELGSLSGGSRQASLNAFYAALEERQSGGPIPGPAGSPYPIMAHGGEFVLSADVVSAVKRGGTTEGLNSRGGASAPYAGVGPAPLQLNLNFNGPVFGGNARALAREIGDEVLEHLRKKNRQSGTLGFT